MYKNLSPLISKHSKRDTIYFYFKLLIRRKKWVRIMGEVGCKLLERKFILRRINEKYIGKN
ncbi:MAG: hypothetical protein IPH52_16690 [Leptospiraceae bacterium]|nr:hypothetical protein [Leptospiraceae bacterium]